MTKTEDLSTMQGRVAWFCEQFDVKPPKLNFDPDEPDAVIMTDEILAWARKEGASVNWLVSGSQSEPVTVLREKQLAREKSREAFEESDRILNQAVCLLDAFYDLAMQSQTLGASEPEAMQLFGLLDVSREKARAAQKMLDSVPRG